MEKRVCFFLMPFTLPYGEYFYLQVRAHLEARYPTLECQRVDTRSDTEAESIIDAIRLAIQSAAIIIADLTGANPNVLYELGMADAWDKPVILVSHDDPKTSPFDVRHRRIYALDHPAAFFQQLDEAFESIFKAFSEQQLYEQAGALAEQFERDTHGAAGRLVKTSKKEFLTRLRLRTSLLPSPDPANQAATAEYLLPLILENAYESSVQLAITRWVQRISDS
ncbi:MAG: hypothetical protein SF162_07515 [bacterium]|nr:hypothetical protein [bacterium]